jgi:hypothetical protein
MSSAPTYLVDLSEDGKGKLRCHGIKLKFMTAEPERILVSKSGGTDSLLVTIRPCERSDDVGRERAVVIRDNGTWVLCRAPSRDDYRIESLIVTVTKLNPSVN